MGKPINCTRKEVGIQSPQLIEYISSFGLVLDFYFETKPENDAVVTYWSSNRCYAISPVSPSSQQKNHTIPFRSNTFNMVSLRSGKRASDNGTPSIEPLKKKVKAVSRAKAPAKSKTPAKAEAKVKEQTPPPKTASAAQLPKPEHAESSTKDEADVKDEES